MTTKEHPEFLFVYGSLMKGQALHSHLEHLKAEFVGPAKIKGRLYDLGAFPGAKPNDHPQAWVFGELWLLREGHAGLAYLDDVEGDLYARYKVTAWSTSDNNQSLTNKSSARFENRVWAYFYRNEVTLDMRVPDGIWHPAVIGVAEAQP